MVHTTFGITDRMKASRYYGLVGRMWTCVTVMGRTSIFRLMWKIKASERPSNVVNRPSQGASPGTDSGHAYLCVRLVTPNKLPPADKP